MPLLPRSAAPWYASLFWTGVLSVLIGLAMSSAFSAIVVFAQELVPGKVGIGAAAMGHIADASGIEQLYRIASFLPLLGVLAAFLPKLDKQET